MTAVADAGPPPRKDREQGDTMTQEKTETPPGRRMPETDDFPSGPAIGEPMPDFTLVNQRGESTNFAAARSGKKALVVFHRSVRW